MAAATESGPINLEGRRPQVVSPMGNGVIWLFAALAVLFVGVVILGFRTRFKKKQEMTQATATQVVAHDAAPSNREQVRNGTDKPLTPLSAISGGVPQNPGTGGTLLDNAGHAIVGAVKTDAHPFPVSGSPGAAPYYYVPPPYRYPAAPAPQPNGVLTATSENPIEKARDRAAERREQAINAPTGIAANSNNGAAVARAVDPIQADLDRISQLSAAANGIPHNPMSTGYPSLGGPGSGAAVSSDYDLNQQDSKRKFQQEQEGDYLKTTRVPPLSPWVVERGDKITAILPTRIVSDLPGDLVAEVKSDVYDSPTHKFILIPAGSLLAGEYNSSVSYGQGRVQVVWSYLRFPDGSFVNLDKFISHGADGAVGLKDQTDNHLKRLAGGVLLSSIFAAGIQISQNRSGSNSTLAYPSTSQVVATAVGQQASQVGEQITGRNLNVQPTLNIRPGEVFYVSVQKSILFGGPYEPMQSGMRR